MSQKKGAKGPAERAPLGKQRERQSGERNAKSRAYEASYEAGIMPYGFSERMMEAAEEQFPQEGRDDCCADPSCRKEDVIELRRAPGICCPEPSCDYRKGEECEMCGHKCSECQRPV